MPCANRNMPYTKYSLILILTNYIPIIYNVNRANINIKLNPIHDFSVIHKKDI